MPASPSRRLLAWVLDLALFCAVGAVAMRTVGMPPAFVLLLAAFIPIRFLAARYVDTPGRSMLSIDPDDTVDDLIHADESAVTLTLGAFFIIEGALLAAFWGDFSSAVHGVPAGGEALTQSLVGIGLGALFVLTGWALLKLRRAGFWLGGLGAGLWLMAAMAPVMETGAMTADRDDLTGLEVAAGPAWVVPPAALMVLGAVMLVGLVLSRDRLVRRG